jgi:hypothetical protein
MLRRLLLGMSGDIQLSCCNAIADGVVHGLSSARDAHQASAMDNRKGSNMRSTRSAPGGSDFLSIAVDAARMGAFHFDVENDRLTPSDELLALLGIDKAQFGGTMEAVGVVMHPAELLPRAIGSTMIFASFARPARSAGCTGAVTPCATATVLRLRCAG